MNRSFALLLCVLVGMVTACGGRPVVSGTEAAGGQPDAAMMHRDGSVPIDNTPMGLGDTDAS
ncbi:MAG TPA: hypothetical protein VL137_03390, partial [Polyangiaceae bacterium]|nr:hypothetical protein [Polyangiaceae bacterium]